MGYLSLIFFTSITVAAQAIRVAAMRYGESVNLSAARGQCSPVMAIHICKTGGAKWSIADRVSGLDADDKKCMSLLCDKKKKQQCCDARDALLLAGVPVQEFKYAEDAEIRVPTRPDQVPAAIVVDVKIPEKTTCSRELRLYTFDTFQRSFSLPETKMGSSADVVCGYGAKDPEAKVTFFCDNDRKWTKTSGTCERDEAVRCPAHEGPHAARLQVSFANDAQAFTNYYFDLAEQPNAFGQDIVVSVKCPPNARNKAGRAMYICHGNGSWSYGNNETCSRPAAGACYPREVTLAINEHEMSFKIPEKGPNIPYTDGEEVTDVPCKFGKFNQGSASLTCKAGSDGTGAWVFNHELCHAAGLPALITEPEAASGDAKSCNTMEFNYTLNHVSHVYVLDKDELGATKSEPCSHGKLTEGEVLFECKESEQGPRWKLMSKTCKAPAGSGCGGTKAPLRMTINGEKFEWLFILEETQGPGMHEFPCQGGYTGSAQFECTPENRWTYKKGSAKCVKD